MANEVTLTSFADELATEQLAGVVALLLADRGALPNHPALIEYANAQQGGSATVKASALGLMGYDLPAEKLESESISNTALSDASASLTIGKKGKIYTATTLARLLDPTGTLNAQVFAADAVASGLAWMLYQVAQLMDDFATTSGTSGADASAATILDAITSLEINKVPGPYLSIMHPRLYADIRDDVALNSGGAVQWSADSQAMLSIMHGLGAQPRLFGVDVMTSTHCYDDSTDVWGGVFGRGAIIYGWASPSVLDLSSDQVVLANKFLFDRVRSALADTTGWAMHMYTGVVELIDLAGVSMQAGNS
jgi:hypothetical protein